jgi:hypothetical protein
MNAINPVIVHEDLASTILHPIALEARQFHEGWLQEFLFRHPELLPASAVDTSFAQLIPLAREFPTTVGPIDILYTTPEGQLCIVETKLWRNPEAHRTVLAQILEYATHLANLEYTDFKTKVEAIAPRVGYPTDLIKIVANHVPKAEFDGIAFEDGVRRSLATGSFLLLIVGDRIRPEVAMLSEIIGTAPNLEFALGLIEIAFFHVDKKDSWPVLAVPTVVSRTHEVTRAVVRIRYEQAKPEVEVTAEEDNLSRPGRINLEVFKKSLPQGLGEIFQPYIERWSTEYEIHWGSVGFSLGCPRKGKRLVVLVAYPRNISVFLERWMQQWDDPIDAYQAYRKRLETISEIQQVYSQGRKYAFYDNLTQDEVSLLLEATDQLAKDLVAKAK